MRNKNDRILRKLKKIEALYKELYNGKDTACNIDPYSKIINDYPPLKTKTEKNLIYLYHNNKDIDARDQLIKHSLYICYNVAKEFTYREVEFEDIFEEANMALMFAIDSYDYNSYHGFSSFAYKKIYKHLLNKYYSNFNGIKIDEQDLENAFDFLKNKNELEEKLNKQLSISEISKYMDINYIDALLYNAITSKYENLNSRRNENDFDTTNLDNNYILKSVISTLPTVNQYIVLIRYGFYDGISHTLEETADILYSLGISNDRYTKAYIKVQETCAIRELSKKVPSLTNNLSKKYYKNFMTYK